MRNQEVDDQDQEQRRRPGRDLDILAELEVRVYSILLHRFVAEEKENPDTASHCCAIQMEDEALEEGVEATG